MTANPTGSSGVLGCPVLYRRAVGRNRFIAPYRDESRRPWQLSSPRRRNKAIAPYELSFCQKSNYCAALTADIHGTLSSVSPSCFVSSILYGRLIRRELGSRRIFFPVRKLLIECRQPSLNHLCSVL